MRLFRFLPFIGLLLALASPASAQSGCGGQFPANTYCGNNTGAKALPGAIPYIGVIGPGTSVVGDLVLWNNTTSTLVKDAGFGVAGIDANVVNTQTTNYAIATTDCGKTIQAGTGSTGQFTLTLPSVSGFPANCSVAIKNGDSTRGKVLVGFPAGFASAQNVLWPLQYGTVRIINGGWAAGVTPGQWIASAGVTLQANHSSGVNTNNDCLGTGAGACATIIHASQLFQTAIKVPGGANPTVQSDCGFTETPSGAFLGPMASGSGVLFIIGNEGSPASCVWNTGGISFDDGNVTSLRGFTLRSSGTFAFVQKGGILVFANVICGASAACFQVAEGGQLTWDPGTLQLGEAACAPNCFSYAVINNGGEVAWAQASVTVPNALNFITIYSGNYSGSRGLFSTTFSGPGSGAGSTGTKFEISNNAYLGLAGTVFPGNTAGTITSGACLEGACAKITNLQFPAPVNFAAITGLCAAGTEGAQQSVADSPVNTWGTNITVGGGAFHVNAYCNGTNWTVSAK